MQPSIGGEDFPANIDKPEIIELVLYEPEPQDDAIEGIDGSALIITHEPSETKTASEDIWLEAEEEQSEAEQKQDSIGLLDIDAIESGETFAIPEQFIIPSAPEITFETTSDDIEMAVATDEGAFQEMIRKGLLPLEPQQAEAVAELVDEIQELAIGIHETNAEHPLAEEELKEKLIKLLETLDIDYDEETVENFIASILLENLTLPINAKVDSNLDPGTREKKITSYLIVRNLTNLINKIPSLFKLGKFALNYTRQISL